MKRTSFLVVLILLFSIGMVVYSNSLNNDFQFDDIRQIKNNEVLASESLFPPEIVKRFPYRAFPYWTFLVNAKIAGGIKPFLFHLTNILIHCTNAFLLFLIFYRILNQFNVALSIRNHWVAVLGSVLFLIHPIGSDLINQVVLRTELLSTMFYLLAFYFYIRVSGRRFTYMDFFIVGFFFVLAIDSKASAISLPFSLILYNLCTLKGAYKDAEEGSSTQTLVNLGLRRQWVYLISIFFLVFFFLLWRGIVWQSNAGNVIPYFITQLSVIPSYLLLYLRPIGVSVDFDVAYRSLFDPATLLAISFWIVSLIYFFRLLKSNPIFTLLWFWTLLAIIPTSSIVPRGDLMMFYRFYLPSSAFAMFLALSFCYSWKVSRRFQVGLVTTFGMLVFLFGGFAYARNFTFESDLVLWQDTANKAPNKERVLNNLGQAYIKNRQYDEAIKQFEKIIFNNTQNEGVWSNLGFAYQKKKAYRAAETCFRRAYYLNPTEVELAKNLAIQLRLSGDYDLSNQVLREFNGRVETKYPGVYHLMAKNFTDLGQYKKAAQKFKETMELDPNEAEYVFSLGQLYKRRRNTKKARTRFEKAVRLNPEFSKGHNSLGLIYKQIGENKLAEKAFLKAIETNPRNIFAMNNLANFYVAEEEYDKAIEFYNLAIVTQPSFEIARKNLLALAKKIKK